MATKKAATEKTLTKAATPVKAAEKAPSAPVAKMTKTQVLRALADKLGVEAKQVQILLR